MRAYSELNGVSNICLHWVVNMSRGTVEAGGRGGKKQETTSGVNFFNKSTSTKFYFTGNQNIRFFIAPIQQKW